MYNSIMEKQRQPDPIELHSLQGVERGRLLLGVPAVSIDIPPVVESYAQYAGFKPKDEYHATVIGKRTQEWLLAEGVLDEAVELLENVPQWNIVSLGDILLLRNIETVDNGEQVVEESIIQLVTLPGLDAFYNQLRAATDLDIPTPPAHITLFTKNADRGIGLYSNTQLTDYIVKKLA
jgi:hypothetical protein